MRLFSSHMLISALLIAGSPLLAAPPAADGTTPATEPKAGETAQVQVQQPEKEKPKPKLICRTIRNTGFRTAARQCKTQDDWEEEDAKVENGEDLRLKTGSLNPG